MKLEEYETAFRDMVSNPDTLQTSALSILEEIKKDKALSEANITEIDRLNNKVRDLQDTNTKLFLSMAGDTSSDDEDNEEPLTGMEAMDAFINSLFEESED